MNKVWDDLVARNQVAGYLDANLRGASQVFLQDNPWTGLMILAAIFWGAHAAGNLEVAFGAAAGLVISTFVAILLRADPASIQQGLFGFNGILVGAAIPTYLVSHPAMWVFLVIGAAVSTILTLAISNITQTWGVSGSTAPFIFTTQLLLLAASAFANVPLVPMQGAANAPAIWPSDGFDIVARSISQVHLIGNVVTGVLFLIAIAINSFRSAVFAVLGAIVSLVVAVGFGANSGAISAGLYGYSAVLTAIAVGAVLNRPSTGVTFYAIFAMIFTVIVQAALNTAMAPIGIPALTLPYVLTMWLFQLPKAERR
ncbi:urea transporter [Bryobacter aggregatus]|uniref:urea transporter n=1 Tax=Bryobacter aggregatus TaxID=360054 RepID=UPI00192E6D6B|nr:urea transporter [Bryobacter aggregatus]